jgi:CelD/BcsL family acetyltransferase involved in cellulose biosynthesis
MVTATMLKPVSATASFRHDVQACETLDAFRALQPQWRSLAASAEAHAPFINFEYCELAVERALASGAAIEVAMVYDGRDLLALWPVAIVRQGVLRIAQSLSCGCGEEYGGPLIKNKHRPELYQAAVAAIRLIHADVLDIPMLETASALHRALDAAPRSWVQQRLPLRWREMLGYAIQLRNYPAWDDFLSTRHASFRSNLRSSLKRLRKHGEVSFGWCSTAEDTEILLTWLLDNKRRWALTRGIDTPYLMNDQVRDFFATLARRIDLSSTPLVAYIKVDGKPVAASINLIGPSTMEYFITTYDEAFGTYSVGNLLVEYLARWAHEHHRDFDFRPLHGDYKARWADRVTQHELRRVVLTARGRLIEVPLLWVLGIRIVRKVAKEAAKRVLPSRSRSAPQP